MLLAREKPLRFPDAIKVKLLSSSHCAHPHTAATTELLIYVLPSGWSHSLHAPSRQQHSFQTHGLAALQPGRLRATQVQGVQNSPCCPVCSHASSKRVSRGASFVARSEPRLLTARRLSSKLLTRLSTSRAACPILSACMPCTCRVCQSWLAALPSRYALAPCTASPKRQALLRSKPSNHVLLPRAAILPHGGGACECRGRAPPPLHHCASYSTDIQTLTASASASGV